jgi:malonyl-CoA O-methyltransferase
MTSTRSAAIARRFGARAHAYDDNADLQRIVAKRLAHLLPPLKRPRVLELGCGTGLFSRELIARYPGARITLSDLSPAMIAQCRANLSAVASADIRFEQRDANAESLGENFDVIAMSMTLHWLHEPLAALARLRQALSPGGALVYATISGESFPEWRDALAREKLPSGLIDIPDLPGIVEEESLRLEADTLSFLRRMQAVGGLMPKEGYRPLPAGALRRAIRTADADEGGVTWHIVYGRLGPAI